MEKFNQYFTYTIKNKYIDFNGRATRSEYRYFALFYFIIGFALSLVDIFVINLTMGAIPDQATSQIEILQIIFTLALLLPKLAVGVRRLHNTRNLPKDGTYTIQMYLMRNAARKNEVENILLSIPYNLTYYIRLFTVATFVDHKSIPFNGKPYKISI